MKKILYFAYGSNLDREQMRRRCPGAVPLAAAGLPGFRLAERQCADVEPTPGECVHGALYQLSPADLARLDQFEGFPDCYDRAERVVCDENGTLLTAWVYSLTEAARKTRDGVRYRDDYRQRCSAGARAWGIPDAFRSQAKTVRHTLFAEKPVSTGAALAAIARYLQSGEPLPQSAMLWYGADTAIRRKALPRRGDWGGFYPAPRTVVTEYAAELSWLFADLRTAFAAENRLDGCSRIEFFGRLAKAANRALQAEVPPDGRMLCSAVLAEAETMMREMDAGSFRCLFAAFGNEIADDRRERKE